MPVKQIDETVLSSNVGKEEHIQTEEEKAPPVTLVKDLRTPAG